MTTLQGFTDGSYDYKHMYNIKDLNGPAPVPVIHGDTLLSFLASSSKYTPFMHLVEKAGLAGKLNSKQAAFTLFVPVGMNDIATKVDMLTAKKIVLGHMLERTIPYPFILSSRMMYLDTRIQTTRILVENYGAAPILNREASIIGHSKVGNAIVYLIDNPLSIDRQNPLVNIDI